MFVMIGILVGCSRITEPVTIGDLAYDANKRFGYTVYIKEEGFEPYFVISSNYDGHALLLRKYLLDDTMPFNENERHMWASWEYGGYYEDSSIDSFLNTNFIDTLNQTVKEYIVSSNIIITAKSSLGVTGTETTAISRKIFLLSLKELYGTKMYTSATEGNTLKYFRDDYSRRSTIFKNEEKSAYWTRTPETWETCMVFTIGSKGIGAGGTDIQSGVRPAFCVSSDEHITQRDDIIPDEIVYVLE